MMKNRKVVGGLNSATSNVSNSCTANTMLPGPERFEKSKSLSQSTQSVSTLHGKVCDEGQNVLHDDQPPVRMTELSRGQARTLLVRPGAISMEGLGTSNTNQDLDEESQGDWELNPPELAPVVSAFLVDEDQENAYRREREEVLSREYRNQAYEELARELPHAVEVNTTQQQREQDCAHAASSRRSTFKWQSCVRFFEIVTIAGGIISIIALVVLHFDQKEDSRSTREERLLSLLFPISGISLKNTSSPRGEAFRWLLDEDPLQLDVTQGGVPEFVVIERYVVVLFFLVTGGPTKWRNSLGFLSNSSVCEWFDDDLQKGVRCHKSTGSIYYLRMDKNNLDGTLPDELSALKDLQDLRLSRNSLRGSLPETLGENIRLQVLSVAGGDLGGTIPDLSRSRDLEIVSLASNRLTGSLPAWLAEAPNLKELIASKNLLAGTLPPFRQLSLERLTARRNLFEGSIPGSIGFTSLEDIMLSENFLTGTIPRTVGRLHKLRKVWNQKNLLSGAIPTELGSSEDLTDLNLSKNRLTGTLPTELGHLWKLEILDVNTNFLSGPIPSEIFGLRDVLHFSLTNNSFTGNLTSACCSDQDASTGLCKIQTFEADCIGSPHPEVVCPCCKRCCNDETGICKQIISPQEKCLRKKMSVEEMYAERGTRCNCNKDGIISCRDMGCMHCNQAESMCYVDAKPGIEYTVHSISYTSISVQYVRGRDERVSFKSFRRGVADDCEGAINDVACATCRRTFCTDGFQTFILDCSNLGYGVRSACTEGDDPFRMLWDVINQLDRTRDLPIRNDCVNYNVSHVDT